MVSTTNYHSPHVVLIDFGLAASFHAGRDGACGTPGYIPPETWRTNFWVPKGDVFSLGVMFFQLMSGIDWLFGSYMNASGMEEVARFTCQRSPPFEEFADKPQLQHLLRGMMEKDVARRLAVTTVLQDPWLTTGHSRAKINPQIIDHLKAVDRKHKDQAQMMELMLDQFNLANLYELNEVFKAMDLDHSGSIEVREARLGAQKIGATLRMSPHEVERLITSLADERGHVTYSRFMATMIQRQKAFTGTDLWARFCQIDSNRNGMLEEFELMQVLQSMGYTGEAARRFMRKLDKNNDGSVDFEEFRAAMTAAS